MQKQILVNFWKDKGIDNDVINAFLRVPREFFVSPELFKHAYEDLPLPTIRNQSLSQPTTVMIMTHALGVKEGHKVLEVGSGVGYQASILSRLVGDGKVVSTETIPELVEIAKKNILQLGCSNTIILEKDGSRGVEQEAPFDRVMITCACPKIPEPIVDQVKEGGIIVAPVGDKSSQTMVRATKVGKRLDLEFLGTFAFVPMQGKYGFE
jgi:protein-L-isoaspartate(D-aspartate) O-methyltransferase